MVLPSNASYPQHGAVWSGLQSTGSQMPSTPFASTHLSYAFELVVGVRVVCPSGHAVSISHRAPAIAASRYDMAAV